MDREVYMQRMSTCPQFERFGVEPQWNPHGDDIWGFCHDEVVRQYHDPNIKDDGGVRIRWMMNAWGYAMDKAAQGAPTPEDMQHIAAHVEVEQNRDGYRITDRIVGGRDAPSPELLPHAVETLWTTIGLVRPVEGRTRFYETAGLSGETPTADDFYVELQYFHPFGDGNGRTGKILHNWLMGTLDDPVLVANYFDGMADG